MTLKKLTTASTEEVNRLVRFAFGPSFSASIKKGMRVITRSDGSFQETVEANTWVFALVSARDRWPQQNRIFL